MDGAWMFSARNILYIVLRGQRYRTRKHDIEDEMKVIICGSRTIMGEAARRNIFDALTAFGKKHQTKITEVVEGGYRSPNGQPESVDGTAAEIAKEFGVTLTTMWANWKKHGKAAGPIRNQRMVDYVGKEGGIIALWDGSSKGTEDCMRAAKLAGITKQHIHMVDLSTQETLVISDPRTSPRTAI
jgi:hypothetical protein